jgi:hypothetical protein
VKILPGRFFFSFAASTFLLCSAPAAFATDRTDAREVRLSSVQGDVRLSRGDGKHTDLNQPWEQAQGGELLEQGFALATGNGRAEIEFEDGSAAYLAENSLLLFGELSTTKKGVATRMTLPTGTATFALQPAAGETFYIETPTDNLTVASPDIFFARMDAYLDATALTPQGEKGETMASSDFPKLFIPKGRTLFFQQGESIQSRNSVQAALSQDQSDWLFQLRALAPLVPGGLILQVLPSVSIASLQSVSVHGAQQPPPSTVTPTPATGDWDSWVSSRVQERATITTAALKASGLSTPIAGLNDLYTHGSFFQCAPYGTCWEPAAEEQEQSGAPQAATPGSQSPAQKTPKTVFQPQTVQWTQQAWGICNSYSARRVSRVAHSQLELDELLRQKAAAEHAGVQRTAFSRSCWSGLWVHQHGRYAMVLPAKPHPVCKGSNCRPVHPPHPLFVRVGGKVGLVPRHPDDTKGKLPINLKNGIFVPSAKSGEPPQRVAVNAAQRVQILDKVPSEFQQTPFAHGLPAAAPEIRGHLMQEDPRSKFITAANRSDSHIVYDYKSQKFMMPAASGAKSKEVAVGGISSKGTVGSFADGRSSHYAQSFGRTSAAASYNGGGHNSGSYNGGGRGSYSSSSSYSGGSSGSRSSGSSSSGSSSHSSGGGSFSGSSGSSSSSSSSSSGGGSRGGGGRP